MGERQDDDELAATVPTVPAAIAPTPVAGRASSLAHGLTIGRYQLIAELGGGAMGVVWSALDPNLDRRVAIKVVHPQLASSPEAAGRMLREARALAKVSHRGVVTVHDAGEADGRLYIAMEQVTGTTLGAMFRARPPAELADWRAWLGRMIDAGRGLAAAHASGILHRDFKPDNVLVARDGRVCVADFGLASVGDGARRESMPAAHFAALDATAGLAGNLTQTGALLGTPVYMSPQQLQGDAVDARADQFSFCVATWEAVYGERPFAITGTGWAILPLLVETITAGVIIPPPANTRVPDAVRAVLTRGLRADPAQRWPDVAALLDALDAAAHADASATPAAPAPPAAPTRAWLVPTLAVAVVGVVIASVVVWRARGAQPPAHAEPSLPAPALTPTPAPAAPIAAKLTPLFPIAIRAGISLSPDGTRIAIVNDRVEVRELTGTRSWTSPTPVTNVDRVEIDSDRVRYAAFDAATVTTWLYTHPDAPLQTRDAGGGDWLGTIGDADGVVVMHGDRFDFVVRRDGHELLRIPLAGRSPAFAAAPGGRRFAIIDEAEFTGRLIVGDLDTGRTLTAPQLAEPTALAWPSDDELLYGSGLEVRPTLWSVAITPTAIGTPRELFHADRGWFQGLMARNGAVLVVFAQTSTRARELTAARNRDLDTASVGAALAWQDRALITWNRARGSIERRTDSGVTTVGTGISDEPANATRAGDTLILALRATAGRTIVAMSLTTGAVMWRKPVGTLDSVRCAGDRAAPCFALHGNDLAHLALDELDPATGELHGPTLDVGNAVRDVAVSADGQHVLIASATGGLRELDRTGKQTAFLMTGLGAVRSVAYDSVGDAFVTGTLLRNTYEVGHVDRASHYETIESSERELLSLVRAAPGDDDHVVFLARQLAPTVYRLDGAR